MADRANPGGPAPGGGPAISLTTFVLSVAVGLGVLVRLLPALPGPLTPGDGGLIVVMVEDLRQAGLQLPVETTYNLAGIPFAYPPLALYAGAVAANILNVSSLESVRLVAGLLSLMTLGLFAVLARRLLPEIAAVGAVFMYALMPHAYGPIVAGGGVTRGLGLLLALSTLVIASSKPLDARRGIGLGLLLGLTALSHPQTALYAAAASAVLVTRSVGWRPAVRPVALAAATAIVVVVPWLAVAVGQHGLSSVLAAGHRWDPVLGVIRLVGLTFSGAAFTDVFLVFGVLGLAVETLSRRWTLPLLLACLLICGEAEFIGAVPWSLLGGAGIAFLVHRLGATIGSGRQSVAVGVALMALFLALLSSLGSVVDDTSRLQRVSADQARAMDWVADETEPGTRFIVATTVYWGGDEISEWFPAIAGRQSVATVQGSEWLGADRYTTQLDRHASVIACSRSTAACFSEWAASEGMADAWLFIPKGQVNRPPPANDCCPALRETVLGGDGYEVVYDGPGATVARPRD